MQIHDFVRNFADLFEDLDSSLFKPETKFREIDGWSSISILYIIGMVDEKYQLKIKGEDIQKSQTIKDIYDIIQSRI